MDAKLLDCPLCGKKMSSAATACPHCGHPNVSPIQQPNSTITMQHACCGHPNVSPIQQLSERAGLPIREQNFGQQKSELDIAGGCVHILLLMFVAFFLLVSIIVENALEALAIGAIMYFYLWIKCIIQAVKRNDTTMLILLVFLAPIGIIGCGFSANYD